MGWEMIVIWGTPRDVMEWEEVYVLLRKLETAQQDSREELWPGGPFVVLWIVRWPLNPSSASAFVY
jgi:hypothetical protein